MKMSYKIKKGLECCKKPVCPKDCPYNKPDGICDLTYDMENYISWLEEKVPHWISVEERLPEPSTYVLAITSPGTLSVGRNIIVADYIHPKDENKGIFVIAYAGYDDKSIVNVTHWMPLPDMTKEDEQHE